MNSSRTNSRFGELTEKAKKAKNKLILLDFDGTLVDFTSDAASTKPSKDLLCLLYKIADISDNQLIIITGRKRDEIDKMVGRLPIDIIAEHGAIIREDREWRTLVDGNTDWKKEVLPIITRFNNISPDAFVEEKGFSLAWHYRSVEHQTGMENSRALIKALKKVSTHHNLKVLEGKKVVEIINKNISKGLAVQYLIEKKNYDYILSVGDDRTDEDMFKVLLNNDNAYTVKIGRGNTYAKYKLSNIQQVILLLEQLQIEMSQKDF